MDRIPGWDYLYRKRRKVHESIIAGQKNIIRPAICFKLHKGIDYFSGGVSPAGV